MNKNLIVFFILTVLSKALSAQNSLCGMNQNNIEQAALRAQFNQKEIQLNSLATQYIQQNVGNANNGSNVEIPVVFHIIHEGGPENIADSVLINEIIVLNQRYANTGNYNYADGVNTNIQFCLASVDPYGNPTTGITRTFSSLTNMPLGGDVAVKNLVRWNPYRYLNIWIVKECVIAMGSSAYSSYPWMSLLSDGIVLTAPTTAVVGPNNFLVSHEVGHYFGLYHTNLGDSCVNFNCLLDGDHVCDTPPVYQPEFQPSFCNSSSCSSDMDDTSGFNPFTIDMNDISNIMLPIVGCPYLFTQGQADRMNFFLNNTRYKLLTSNGCGQHPSSNPLPIAQIGNITNTCNGYIFTSYTNYAEYIEWDFNADGITDAVGDSVSYLFSSQGYYTIVLRAFNEVGYDADTLVFQSLAQNNTIFPLSTFIVEGNGLVACLGSNLTLIAVPGMAHYQWSTGDTTQTIVIPVTAPINVTLTCTDSLGMVWQRCPDPTFYWDVAPSPAPFSLNLLTDDTLCTNQMFQAEIPIQPGTFAQIFSDGQPGLINNNLLNLYYYQQNSVYISVVLRYISNFCPTYADDTLHILFTAPVDSIQVPVVNGNYIAVGNTVQNVQWYMDGIAIPWANSDTLFMDSIACYRYEAWNYDRDCSVMSSEHCNTITRINNFEKDVSFKIYPNPNDGNFIVVTTNENITPSTITITDITGRNIAFDFTLLNNKTIQIKAEPLTSGVYILKLNGKTVKLLGY
jgi:hypothetical protein